MVGLLGMRLNEISIGDKVEFLDNLGDLCIGLVMCRCSGRSCFELKDITPDLPERWIEKPGGGAYQIDRVNGFYGEIFKVMARDIKRVLVSSAGKKRKR